MTLWWFVLTLLPRADKGRHQLPKVYWLTKGGWTRVIHLLSKQTV